MTKPFAYAEFHVRVRALLRRTPGNYIQMLRVAGLDVDRLTDRILQAGNRIEPTSKESAFLKHLVVCTGRTLCRTMIVEHLWDENFEEVTNNVDVCGRHLRIKVGDPFSIKLIRIVRGVGYSISEELENGMLL